LQDPPKFTQIWIFGSKRNHLATLLVSARIVSLLKRVRYIGTILIAYDSSGTNAMIFEIFISQKSWQRQRFRLFARLCKNDNIRLKNAQELLKL
jgi:hypothetical protein